MKKVSFLFLVAFIAITSCNNAEKQSLKEQSKVTSEQRAQSERSITGVYSGTLPCADCPGIETSLKFKPQNKVEKTTLYLDSNDTEKTMKGSYKINTDDGLIVVTLSDNKKEFYRMKSDSAIVMLNSDKKEVTGPIADAYVLTK
ncbi:hypothetical protein CK503_15580 [Aliifodinibius salipaludis]|uniref:Copper homeostasis protein n=1 Tax=Fodinibius salipaludis TaxID=2032627 RepID=A0A2A2G761_9BACT|nr:copper resistance protein NlpE [Aliifodinibius salipaludis]PAU92653.1 hypothetical protein CK503_15580 [Aliifodinibius salipaludis]